MSINARRARRGFSLIELLIVIAIILIIAAIAVPKLNVARMQAQEMAAISTFNTIHVAQTSYFSQFGHFAESLVQLGPPAGGAVGPASADLIPGDLATGQKSGYVFTVAASKDGYTITAVPQIFGQTGRRTFFSDQTLTVRENWGADPATAQSHEIK
jgi:prepilin-type N-terminal cleavage/methylation domain-containing protein